MRIRLTSRAYNELEQISEYISERDPRTAVAIFAVLDRIFSRLREMPYQGQTTDVPSVRCLVVSQFPYKVFYRVAGDTIEVLSIFHTSQNPDGMPE